MNEYTCSNCNAKMHTANTRPDYMICPACHRPGFKPKEVEANHRNDRLDHILDLLRVIVKELEEMRGER